MTGIVVIGAGQAGLSLVAKLRSLGYSGALTLIGEEPVPPYQRPPLSKGYLLGEMKLDRLYLRAENFYADQGIALRLGQPVKHVDRVARTVSIGSDVIAFEQMALTTGSVPRRLPTEIGGDLAGVYVVRTLADVDKMAAEFGPGRRVLIVGGGYIGLEAAAVASKKGLEVTLIEAAPRILQRVAASETADFFRALHASHGVTIREGMGLECLQGEDRVTGVQLSDGSEIAVDFVITGIGVSPATALAEAAGLEINNGIKTDEYGQTSDPSIWAAGDCASFPWRGTRIRLESVGNAIDQAEAVAANMLGAGRPYETRPWFWSDQYHVKLQIAGLNAGYDRIVTRGEGMDKISFWYFAGDRLLAVDSINDPRAYMIGKKMLDQGFSPDSAAVANCNYDLRALIK